MSFRDITHPDDLEHSLDGLRGLLSGQIYQAEKRYVHADGHVIWTQLSCSVVCDEQGSPQHFVTQTQDITEPKRLRERLQQAQRLETVGALAGGVAHDFNNLLAVILSCVGFARDELPPDSESRSDIDAIGSAAGRGVRLTEQLLAFAQRKTSDTEVLDIGEVLVGMRALLVKPLGDQIELRYQPGPDLWPVEAARADLEQIILNLVVNARDAVSTQGRITITIANIDLTDDAGAELDVASRALRAPHGRRRRLRHRSRHAGPRLGAVLHDQAARRRQRPRTGQRLRHRPPSGGQCRHQFDTGQRDAGRRVSARQRALITGA